MGADPSDRKEKERRDEAGEKSDECATEPKGTDDVVEDGELEDAFQNPVHGHGHSHAFGV
jgi:hypothetical protein